MKMRRSASLVSVAALVGSSWLAGALVFACGSDGTRGGGDTIDDAGADAPTETSAGNGSDAGASLDATLAPSTDAMAAADAADAADATTMTGDDACAADDDAGLTPLEHGDAAPFLIATVGLGTLLECSSNPSPYVGGFGFGMQTIAELGPACQGWILDSSCDYYRCVTEATQQTPELPPAGNLEVITRWNAGDVSFLAYGADGGLVGSGPSLVLQFNGSGYQPAPGYPSTFAPPSGGSVLFEAAGATGDASIGPFSVRLPSPAVVGITLPGTTVDPPASCGANATTTFPVNQDLAVAWTNGLPGSSVGVTLTVRDSSDGCAPGHVVTKAVSCTFPAGTGAATIPAVGLSKLAVVGEHASGAMTFTNIATQYQTDGPAVLFGDIFNSTSPNGISFTTQ